MAGIGPGPGGGNTVLNLSVATVVKAAPGTLYSMSVTTAGSAAGAIYDTTTTGGVGAANLIATIANAVTAAPLNFNAWPCKAGIVVVPPTGGVVAVAFT